jgi:hypothetical protein
MTLLRSGIRELDRRHNHGLDVQLIWEPQTDRVSVALIDEHSGESLAFEVDPSEALTAFHHPYAYASGGDVVARSDDGHHLDRAAGGC